MPGMLLAYDAAGNVIATLDWMVQVDDEDHVLGVIDFAAHEEADGEHTDIWTVHDGAVGSKVWPEYLGSMAHSFRVELTGPPGRKRIGALVHKASGYRRERAEVERAVRDAPDKDGAKDLRAVIGGPDRPLIIDDEGRTHPRPRSQRPALPLVSAIRHGEG